MMQFQAHRGVSSECPENTMPAFRTAIRQKYDYIETDPAFTRDGQCVLLHDPTLNRTCRLPSGQPLPLPVAIADISYAEVLQYDAGIGFARKYAGTHIPLLQELLAQTKDSGTVVKLDNKIERFSDAQTEMLFRIVAESGAPVAFTCTSSEYIHKVRARFPHAEIHYDGAVTAETLPMLVQERPTTIWLGLPSPAISWVTVPTADDALCATVRKVARLGLWILSSDAQLLEAERLGASVIETTGVLKPVHAFAPVDCHCHTHFSHDSACDPVQLCETAMQRGLAGVSFTDHCDVEFCETQDVKQKVDDSIRAAQRLNAQHSGRLRVFSGVEFGESIWHPAFVAAWQQTLDCDIVLGSVHAVRYREQTIPFAQIDFSEWSESELHAFLAQYFVDMQELVATGNFDVLAHLTVPLRYINGKYQRSIAIEPHRAAITQILRAIIARGVALEVNTSSTDGNPPLLFPEESILAEYAALGGYLITLGSDEHTASRVGLNFASTAALLRRIGFRNAYYYDRRTAIPYALGER